MLSLKSLAQRMGKFSNIFACPENYLYKGLFHLLSSNLRVYLSDQDVGQEIIKMKTKQQKIQEVLSETILTLCNRGFEFDCELEVDGLLGITLDKKDVVLVKISEVIRGDKTLSPNSKHFGYGASELTVESEDVNVPAKRLCTQSRTKRSPKRKKPEDDNDLDNSSPQDLSQRTHSPCSVKQELFTSNNSNSRDSPAAVVQISSTDSNSNHSHLQVDHTSMEHDHSPPVCILTIFLITVKPLYVNHLNKLSSVC